MKYRQTGLLVSASCDANVQEKNIPNKNNWWTMVNLAPALQGNARQGKARQCKSL
jgi:hypothetical protein